MKKNDFNKIMIAMFTAFMICLMSFLTAFGCFKSIQPEDNIAAASIVEEDYNVSSNDIDLVSFNGSNISFYRYMNNTWRTFLAKFSLYQTSANDHWQYILDLSMFGDTVMFKYGTAPNSFYNGEFDFYARYTTFILGSSNSGESLYAYNTSNNSYVSVNNVPVRSWYYQSSSTTHHLSSIVGFDYGMYGVANQILPDWVLVDGVNTIISYFDVYGNRFCFSIGINTNYFIGYDYLTPRTYNFVDTSSDGYQLGYDFGYSAGSSAGYDTGYSAGSSAGYNTGYSAGYTAGENANNPYTFLALLTAVVDAPVQVFSNLFDWNFLGFNLKNFFLSLITICVILIILKYVLGGAGGD